MSALDHLFNVAAALLDAQKLSAQEKQAARDNRKQKPRAERAPASGSRFAEGAKPEECCVAKRRFKVAK